jgi:F-box/leucine-rich repeat protein 2/20
VLSKNCPNLKYLAIDYSRKFEMKLALNLSLNLRNLEILILANCPVIVDMSPLVDACPILAEVNFSGDSWVNRTCLLGLAQHPNIRVFHLGHFEHSDVECKDLLPPADELVENYCE